MTSRRRTFSSCRLACSQPSDVVREQRPGWDSLCKPSCNFSRSHPGKRRRSGGALYHRHVGARSRTIAQSLVYAFIFSILWCCQVVNASAFDDDVQYMAQWSELVYDRSEAPAPPMILHKRAQATSSLPPSITVSSSAEGSSTVPSTTGISTASPTTQNVLPTPFDSSIGNNFTSPSCPAFFQSFLTNDTFKKCSPLSLLLQTSNGFFSAETSPVRLAQTLDASCSVNFTMCASVMASLAQSIQLDSHCGRDLSMQNPTVMQAYNGLLAYQPLFHAGCLTDPDGNYCFANSVQNKSAPTSSYVYYLPLGVQLPAGTNPACNTCLQQTMTIFGNAAGNKSMPLSMDYTPAAQQIDMQCGPQFVVASVAHTSSAAVRCSDLSVGMGLVALAAFAVTLLA